MISYKKYGMHPEQPKNRDAPALLWHSPCTGLGSGQSESGLLRRKKPVDDYSLNGIYSDLMRIYNALIGYEWDKGRLILPFGGFINVEMFVVYYSFPGLLNENRPTNN